MAAVTHPDAVPVRDAATVMLVRDTDAGVEVFMLRRSQRLVFTPGAYVFPGGALDDVDREAAVARVCVGRDDVAASRLLGVTSGGLAYWVAAVRECFEEAGVLLACGADGVPLDLDDPLTSARFRRHRDLLNGGRRTVVDICDAEQVRLDLGAIRYFAHWLTPVRAPRRYNTRFFLVGVPPGQRPLHDDGEAVDGFWIRPQAAITRWTGEDELIRPTRECLEALASYARTDALLADLTTMERVPDVQPRMGADGAGVRVLLPGDDGWEAAVRDATGADG